MFKVKDNTDIIHPMEVADISGSPLGFHKAQNAGLSWNCIEFTGKEVPSDTVYCVPGTVVPKVWLQCHHQL